MIGLYSIWSALLSDGMAVALSKRDLPEKAEKPREEATP
jgi:hypothetical protein